MTSRDGYDAYTLYLGIKLHFNSKDYDFIKYNGKVRSDINSFLKRKDKFHFGKLHKIYKDNLQDFYIANLSQKDSWVGDLLNEEAERVYADWRKRQQKLSYMFQSEVSDVLRKRTIQKVLEVKNGQHPWLLRDYLAKNVSLETLCIMDEIIGFTTDWERLISEKVVYPDVHTKIRKYKTFISVDHKKFKKILLDVCS